MPPRFQIRLRDVLVAMALAAVWFGLHGQYYAAIVMNYRPFLLLYCFLYGGVPAVAVCTLFGRPGLGIRAGAASGLAGALLTDVSDDVLLGSALHTYLPKSLRDIICGGQLSRLGRPNPVGVN